ncbi:hypothetical protein [Ehrlichia japonica]|uniref:ATP-dependent zinc metalloprotease FtsH domain protein n=1 Tax=Ehrlichia japonica TaxID=391036 RepID=X5H4L7_9RICK|nr:hypothetical protein [Ehrlichia japonica]AHX05000.1 ATP-dependent zinc metalloprotease FtsH domain protein [Ehrlichia japonica]
MFTFPVHRKHVKLRHYYIVKNLLEFDTLTGEDIKNIANGKESTKNNVDESKILKRPFASKEQYAFLFTVVVYLSSSP